MLSRFDSVDPFCYFGSVQDSDGRSGPDILRRLGIAATAMGSLSCVWTLRKLSLGTKLRIYQTCILPIALYGSETWTLLLTDTKKLQRSTCHANVESWASGGRTWSATPQWLKQLVCLRSATSLTHVGLHNLDTHRALKLAVEASCRWPPSLSWRRPRGRAVIHGSDRWCVRIHPSNCSRTVLCGVVVVIRRNVSCQTRDHDDDDDVRLWELCCIIRFEIYGLYYMPWHMPPFSGCVSKGEGWQILVVTSNIISSNRQEGLKGNLPNYDLFA